MFGQLVVLALKHEISMERVLSYPLGPVPASLGAPDGFPIKTDKAKLLHSLESDSSRADTHSMSHYVIDGNALLQAQVTLPDTFKELAANVFKQLPKMKRVDFVTDTYLPLSVKGLERERRGTSKGYLIKGPLMKVPRDWKAFMSSKGNKQQLTQFLLSEWRSNDYATKLKDRTVLFVSGEDCISLESKDGENTVATNVEALRSNQEEADTRIVLHCLDISRHSPSNAIITVRSPDTDVFILLLHFTSSLEQTVLFDTGTGDKRRLINVKQVAGSLGPEMSSALPALHSFTGCDTTSAFVRKGKLVPLKTLKRNKDFIDVFLQLGRSPEIEEQTYENWRISSVSCTISVLQRKASTPFDTRNSKKDSDLNRDS